MGQKAEIRYLGHSTAIITTQTGKHVFIDPWLNGNPSCPAEYHEPQQVDFICLTHGHSDHVSSVLQLAKRYGAKIFATYELGLLLVRDGVPEQQIILMNKGGSVSMPLENNQSICVTLTQAFHSSSYDASDGITYYAGEAAGIVLRLESGQTVYHAGDTMLFSDMELIGKRFQPAVALFPIGDRFTMDPSDAAAAVKLVRPKIAIPVHWGTCPLLTGTPEDFTEQVKRQDTDTEVRTLQPGEAFIF